MEEKKKILLLCGGKFAFKALQSLAFEKYLCGIGIGKGSQTVIDTLENASEDCSVAFESFPTKKSILKMKDWIESVQPDYIFSISFPFLIPEGILSYGPSRFINFHLGPLPQYRGAMPIFEVLKNQEKETAICAHFMNSKFDEGPVIFNDPLTIEENDTYGKLTVKMSTRMAQVALNVANMIQYATKIPSHAQNEANAYYYEKPKLSDTCINWKTMDATEIISLINACNPWNIGADAILLGELVKIISATEINDTPHNSLPGTILSISYNDSINIACINNKQIAVNIISTDEGILTAKQFVAVKKLKLD